VPRSRRPVKAFLKRIDEPCGNGTAVKELHGCRSPIGTEPASKIRVGGQRLQRIPESCHVAWRDNDSRVMATHDAPGFSVSHEDYGAPAGHSLVEFGRH